MRVSIYTLKEEQLKLMKQAHSIRREMADVKIKFRELGACNKLSDYYDDMYEVYENAMNALIEKLDEVYVDLSMMEGVVRPIPRMSRYRPY